MCKTYAEVAMDVIREDWEFRKSQHNPSFNQEKIASLMGISRSQLAKALGENKNPIDIKADEIYGEIREICSYMHR